MKREFRAHPLMILNLVKPFLFVLIFPVLKGVLQYILSRRVTGILGLELAAFSAITIIAGLRCKSFKLVCNKKTVTISLGVFFCRKAVININNLSSVQSVQNPLDALFRAVTYCINTEAGPNNSPDFQFKLSQKDSAMVSELLYGKEKRNAVKFSIVKVAFMAATTSSAVTGMIIGVPVINKAGKLLGLALNDIVLDEINNVSGKIKTYFPPIVNAISLVFLLSYAVSFIYLFLKYINFRLFLENDKLEVRSGFFIRSRTSFKKESVNDVIIEQTPLMRLFKRYALKVSVGGYGESKGESAVIVPSGAHGEIKRQFSLYFPFLEPDGRLLHARRDYIARNRFLFLPAISFIITVAVSFVVALIFANFGKLILFLTLVTCCCILYYGRLCLYEFRFGKLRIGDNIFAQSVKYFRTRELYCPKENVGQIKIIRNLADIQLNTCKIVITVRSEAADNIKVRHLDYNNVINEIYKYYNIEV